MCWRAECVDVLRGAGDVFASLHLARLGNIAQGDRKVKSGFFLQNCSVRLAGCARDF